MAVDADEFWTTPDGGLVLRMLDDQFAVFVPATGYTHVVSALAGCVLSELPAQHVLSTTDLARLFADSLPHDRAIDAVRETLNGLEDAGLVRSVSA